MCLINARRVEAFGFQIGKCCSQRRESNNRARGGGSKGVVLFWEEKEKSKGVCELLKRSRGSGVWVGGGVVGGGKVKE